LIHLQTEEIADLRAGNEDRYAVGETDHDGRGKYFTMVPMPVTPRSTSKTPAIMVHMNRPSIPCFGD